MKQLRPYTKAGKEFVSSLFRRRGAPVGFSENGHSILPGWGIAPEEEIIARLRQGDVIPAAAPRLGLYCYRGAHRGELFVLSKERETIGIAADCTLVLTPTGTTPAQVFHLSLKNGIELESGEGGSFRVNGREERRAQLFDFDELELMGNHFLVLERGGVA